MSLADAMYYSQIASQNGGIVPDYAMAARSMNQNSHLYGGNPALSTQASGINPFAFADYTMAAGPGVVPQEIYGMDVRGNQLVQGQNAPQFANPRPGVQFGPTGQPNGGSVTNYATGNPYGPGVQNQYSAPNSAVQPGYRQQQMDFGRGLGGNQMPYGGNQMAQYNPQQPRQNSWMQMQPYQPQQRQGGKGY